MRKIISIVLIMAICCLTFCGCVAEEETITITEIYATTIYEENGDIIDEKSYNKPAPETLYVGNTVTSNDWRITLTNAYSSNVLQSSESSTIWEAESGYAFLVLEMDVECLNSSRKPVDGDAIAEPVATTVNGNTYSNWEYQYIAGQIWCYFMNTCLDANLPIHAYVYTYIPESTMNSPITVDVQLAGHYYQLSIN